MTDENEREAIKCDFEAALAGGCAGHGPAQGEVDAEMAAARQAAREASEAAALAEAETSVEITPGPGLDWSGRKLRLGIDVGSTTVKLAVLDEDAKLVYASYQRHHTEVRATVKALFRAASEVFGDERL